MNDIYYNIIIIVLVIVLLLAYILIAYFYSSYSNYKEDVDDNFSKTKDYINTTISKLDNNLHSSIAEYDNKMNNTCNYMSDINKKVNKVDINLQDNNNEFKNYVSSTNNNFSNINSYSSNVNSQLSSNNLKFNKFDANIKQFIQFKSKGININDAIFNYQLGIEPNLSLDFVRNVNAISGMTVETENSTDTNFRLCDKSVNKNCMDMNIDNKGLNIFPTKSTPTNYNTTKNIYIYDKDKKNVIAKFDLENRGIFLGGEGDKAAMYIKDNNVYFKNIKVLTNDVSFDYINIKDKPSLNIYDKSNKNIEQPFINTYPIDITDFDKENTSKFTGIYTIIRKTMANTIIINFKCSTNYSYNNSFVIRILELNNTKTTDVTSIGITQSDKVISSVTLLANSNLLQFKLSSSIIADFVFRIELTSSSFVINPIFTEPVVTNFF